MNIAFIIDPLPTLKAYKDSSIAMMRAAQVRGHNLYVLEVSDLFAEGAADLSDPRTAEKSASCRICARACKIVVNSDNEAWYQFAESNSESASQKMWALQDFDALIMRKDPPFDMAYVTATWLLELAAQQGARVFNAPNAIRSHNEKLAILQFPQFIAPTLASNQVAQITAFHEQHHDIILKPLDGMGGTGIFRVKADGLNLNATIESLTQNNRTHIMAQRYLPQIADGDKRILLINGKVVPYALARIPQPGETRGNLAAGGRGVARELSPRNREVAEHLAPILAARGLFLVGLDMIGDCLTEINVTSPTCFVEITQQTGFDVAALFVQELETVCALPINPSNASRL